MATKIYGIKNCDTMKKAFDWLKAKGIAYDFMITAPRVSMPPWSATGAGGWAGRRC
jgi:hypothetical protein